MMNYQDNQSKQPFGFGIAALLLSSLLFSAMMHQSCKQEETAYDFSSEGAAFDFSLVDRSVSLSLFEDLSRLILALKTVKEIDAPAPDYHHFYGLLRNQDGVSHENEFGLYAFLQDADQGTAQALMQQMAEVAERYASPALPGHSGFLTNEDGDKFYLVDEHGIELATYAERWLSAAVFYQQALQLIKTSESVDLSDQKQNWELAFSFFGVPADFPDNTEGLRYWGKWCDDREDELHHNTAMIGHFAQGRAALEQGDSELLQSSKEAIPYFWDRIILANLGYQLLKASENYEDLGKRCRKLSMARGFLHALRYNPNSALPLAQQHDIDLLLSNNYTASRQGIMAAIDLLLEVR